MLVLLWLLHQKGLFDPFYDWWEDHFGADNQSIRQIQRQRIDFDQRHHDQPRHHKHGAQYKRRSNYNERRHNHSGRDTDYYYHLNHVHKDKHKHGHGRSKHLGSLQQVDDNIGHHRRIKERETVKGLPKASRYM